MTVESHRVEFDRLIGDDHLKIAADYVRLLETIRFFLIVIFVILGIILATEFFDDEIQNDNWIVFFALPIMFGFVAYLVGTVPVLNARICGLMLDTQVRILVALEMRNRDVR